MKLKLSAWNKLLIYSLLIINAAYTFIPVTLSLSLNLFIFYMILNLGNLSVKNFDNSIIKCLDVRAKIGILEMDLTFYFNDWRIACTGMRHISNDKKNCFNGKIV